jgi:hypothetical protein
MLYHHILDKIFDGETKIVRFKNRMTNFTK